MPFPLIPVLAASALGLTTGLIVTRKKKPKGLTPERQKIYEAALTSLKDPNGLDKLADAFGKEDLHDEANLLRKRAILRRRTPAEKQADTKIFKDALSSKNSQEVMRVANELEEKGCTGAAYRLKQYAKGLQGA